MTSRFKILEIEKFVASIETGLLDDTIGQDNKGRPVQLAPHTKSKMRRVVLCQDYL